MQIEKQIDLRVRICVSKHAEVVIIMMRLCHSFGSASALHVMSNVLDPNLLYVNNRFPTSGSATAYLGVDMGANCALRARCGLAFDRCQINFGLQSLLDQFK